ncbi:WD40 repeat domain-containing protein [Kitasatospora sp. NPDC001574]
MSGSSLNSSPELTALSADGELVAEVVHRGPCLVWHRATGAVVASVETPAHATAVAFGDDRSAHLLVIGDEAGGVHTWSQHGGHVALHSDHGCRVTAVAPGPGGLVLSGDENGSVRVWNTTAGAPGPRIDLELPEQFGKQVTSLTVRPDGERFAAGTASGRMFLGDVHSPAPPRLVFKDGPRLQSVAFATRAEAILAAGGTSAQLWDPTTSGTWSLLHDHRGTVVAAALDPRAARVATGGTERIVRIWDTSTAEVVHRLTDLNGWVLALRFVADGTQLVAVDGDGEAGLWDVRTGALLARSHRLGSRSETGAAPGAPAAPWQQEAARHDWSRIACSCRRGARHVPEDFARLMAARTPEEASGHGLVGDVESQGFLSEASLPLASMLLLALEHEQLSAPARYRVLDLLMACVEGEADLSASAAGHPDIEEECCDAVRRGIPLFYEELAAGSTPGAGEPAYLILRALGEDTERLDGIRKAGLG